MKKLLTMALAALLVLSLCTGFASAENGKPIINIAYSLDSMNEGNNVIIEGQREWLEAYNADPNSQYFLKLAVFDAGGKIDKQIADVETIIVDGYDALIISAVDNQGSIPAAEAAYQEGLFVVDYRGLATDQVSVHINMYDEHVLSSMMREWLQNKLDADENLTLNIGLVYGAAAQSQQLERCDFVHRWVDEGADRVKISAEAYCDWDTAKAMNTVEDWLQSNPEINVIVCASNEMAQGVDAALRTNNIRDKVWLITYDITSTTVERIENGTIDMCTGLPLDYADATFIRIAYEGATGQYTGGKEFSNDNMAIIDITNVADYK